MFIYFTIFTFLSLFLYFIFLFQFYEKSNFKKKTSTNLVYSPQFISYIFLIHLISYTLFFFSTTPFTSILNYLLSLLGNAGFPPSWLLLKSLLPLLGLFLWLWWLFFLSWYDPFLSLYFPKKMYSKKTNALSKCSWESSEKLVTVFGSVLKLWL